MIVCQYCQPKKNPKKLLELYKQADNKIELAKISKELDKLGYEIIYTLRKK